MSIFYKYAEMIDETGIDEKIIANIIDEHAEMAVAALEKYGRYQQSKEDTPIMQREFEGEAAKKINNKLANDFFGEIVDTKVGYMFGHPVVAYYDRKVANHETVIDHIERFRKVNDLDDLNAEWCKKAAIAGYSSGLCYIDKEGQERVKQIEPWESIIISKTAITEPEYGINYYTTWDDKCRVDFYDSTHRITFEGSNFSAGALEEVERKTHMFSGCPLFGIPNNEEFQGDGDKVFSLIDAFDRSLSDMNNEVEQFRLAYMIFIGSEPTEELLEEMVKSGALYMPDAEDGADIRWLTKDLSPEYIDSHLDRLEANITRFSRHVNFTDAAFSGDITGPAMRYKLFLLETKSKYFERKHEASMLYMFKIIGSAWGVKGITFDYTYLDMRYSRNIPVNILDEAQAAIMLGGITSKRTALGTLTIVPDIEEEMERIEEEKSDNIDLDKIIEQEKKKHGHNDGSEDDEGGGGR